MTRSDIRILAAPYGMAAILVLVTWMAGGVAGAETELSWRGWITIGLAFVVFAGWLAAMILALRRLRRWALIAAPSALLVLLTATGIPLIAGACMLARACI